MRISLSHMLLLMVIAALAIGWWCDRTRSYEQNRSLNAECAALMAVVAPRIRPNDPAMPNDKWSRLDTMFYDFKDPQDRANFRAGRPAKLINSIDNEPLGYPR